MGGALSLYLGIAIVMCFEILELGVDIVLNVWVYLNSGGGVAKNKKKP